MPKILKYLRCKVIAGPQSRKEKKKKKTVWKISLAAKKGITLKF